MSLELKFEINLYKFVISKLIEIIKEASLDLKDGLEKEKILEDLRNKVNLLIKDYNEEEKLFSEVII